MVERFCYVIVVLVQLTGCLTVSELNLFLA